MIIKGIPRESSQANPLGAFFVSIEPNQPKTTKRTQRVNMRLARVVPFNMVFPALLISCFLRCLIFV